MISLERQAFVVREWREAVAEDQTIRDVHRLAREQVIETLLVEAEDAEAEAERQLALRGARRGRVEFALPLTMTTAAIDIGTVLNVVHRRYGFQDGARFVVLGVQPDYRARRVRLSCWGARLDPEPEEES